MTYAYCDGCDCELDEPTTREIIEQTWHCRSCMREIKITSDLFNKALSDMLNMIESNSHSINQTVTHPTVYGSKTKELDIYSAKSNVGKSVFNQTTTMMDNQQRDFIHIVMQNPLKGEHPIDEDEDEDIRKIRIQLFELTKP